MWFEALVSQNARKSNWIIKAAVAFQKAILNLEKCHKHLWPNTRKGVSHLINTCFDGSTVLEEQRHE